MKRRKTAGVWEPDADPMFFFAGLTYRANIFSHDPRVPALLAVNDIAQTGSPLKRSNTAWQQVLRSLDAGQPFFLDSGVFNLTNEHMRAHGITMDEALSLAPSEIDNFDWLFDTYVEILREISDQLWGYVEIDQGGMDNKEATRRRLQAAGFEPIPVYHPLNDGWEYFDTLASNYDRMCIGNLVQASPNIRDRIITTVTERLKDYPPTWTHFLGVTPSTVQWAQPMCSADSSSYSYGWRTPDGAKVQAMGNRRWSMPIGFRSELRSESDLPQDEWRKRYKRDAEVQIVDQHMSMMGMADWYEQMRNLGVPNY
tara:strand:- start:721 stop:1656 length:936 start_codon:yes stop_codon:yes gene_type:complete